MYGQPRPASSWLPWPRRSRAAARAGRRRPRPRRGRDGGQSHGSGDARETPQRHADPRFHSERRPRRHLRRARPSLRPGRRRRSARDRADRHHRLDQAARDRQGQFRDPRHPRPGDRRSIGADPPRAGRDHGDRRAPAGGGDCGARHPLSEGVRGQDGRDYRGAERHRRAPIGGHRVRRGPGEGQDDHDRLQRGRRPARRPSRRRAWGSGTTRA